jgi:hypothetical protein
MRRAERGHRAAEKVEAVGLGRRLPPGLLEEVVRAPDSVGSEDGRIGHDRERVADLLLDLGCGEARGVVAVGAERARKVGGHLVALGPDKVADEPHELVACSRPHAVASVPVVRIETSGALLRADREQPGAKRVDDPSSAPIGCASTPRAVSALEIPSVL